MNSQLLLKRFWWGFTTFFPVELLVKWGFGISIYQTFFVFTKQLYTSDLAFGGLNSRFVNLSWTAQLVCLLVLFVSRVRLDTAQTGQKYSKFLNWSFVLFWTLWHLWSFSIILHFIETKIFTSLFAFAAAQAGIAFALIASPFLSVHQPARENFATKAPVTFLAFFSSSAPVSSNVQFTFGLFLKYTCRLSAIICTIIFFGTQLFDWQPIWNLPAISTGAENQNGNVVAAGQSVPTQLSEHQKTTLLESQTEVSKATKGPTESATNTFHVKHEHVRPADFLGVANLACNTCIAILMLLTLIYGGKS